MENIIGIKSIKYWIILLSIFSFSCQKKRDYSNKANSYNASLVQHYADSLIAQIPKSVKVTDDSIITEYKNGSIIKETVNKKLYSTKKGTAISGSASDVFFVSYAQVHVEASYASVGSTIFSAPSMSQGVSPANLTIHEGPTTIIKQATITETNNTYIPTGLPAASLELTFRGTILFRVITMPPDAESTTVTTTTEYSRVVTANP